MTAEQAAFCLFGIKPSAEPTSAFCVSGTKPSAEPTSAFSLGDKLATVRRRKDADEKTKLYDFMKEGKYVDVTLQFDDDHKITAHRYDDNNKNDNNNDNDNDDNDNNNMIR